MRSRLHGNDAIPDISQSGLGSQVLVQIKYSHGQTPFARWFLSCAE